MTSDDLIQTLRAFSRLSSCPSSPSPDFMGEVADRLEALQARVEAAEASYVRQFDKREALEAKNERLREALEPLIDYAKDRAADAPEWNDSDTVQITIEIGDLRRAAALGKEDT